MAPSAMALPNNDFARTTSFHGIPYIPNATTNAVKTFWSVVLVAAFAMAIYSTILVIQDYINAPVAVTMSSEKSPTLMLPDLVICPTRGLDVSRMILDRMPTYIIDKIMQFVGVDVEWVPIGNTNAARNNSLANQVLKDSMIQHNLSCFKNLLTKYSYNPSQFIHRFKYTTNEYVGNGTAESIDMLFGKLIRSGGVCFTYVETSRSANWPGISSGFELILKLPQLKSFENSFTDGWDLAVVKPLQAEPNSYVKILPNTAVDIEISRFEVNRFSQFAWPKSDRFCKDSLSYKTSDSCAQMIYGDMHEKFCNCSFVGAPIDPTRKTDFQICNPFELDICYTSYLNDINNQFATLVSECLPVCKETIFHARPTYGHINKRSISRQLNISMETDISIVRISYTRMEYTKISSYESITISTVISNIGGQLGLWIGASIVSIVHLISYVPFWLLANRSKKAISNGIQTVIVGTAISRS